MAAAVREKLGAYTFGRIACREFLAHLGGPFLLGAETAPRVTESPRAK